MNGIRHAEDRGRSISNWLTSRHSLSFGEYQNPDYRRFHRMRVLNDDVIAPGAGFDAHDHEDVEIVSYIVRGRLAHRDSSGHSGELRAHDVQRITAGTGIRHEEYNASEHEPLRLVQPWFEPDTHGLEPGYEQGRFGTPCPDDTFELLVSSDGGSGALSIHSDVRVHRARLAAGAEATLELDRGRHAWLHVVSGEARAADVPIAQGDAALFEGAREISVCAETETFVLTVESA